MRGAKNWSQYFNQSQVVPIAPCTGSRKDRIPVGQKPDESYRLLSPSSSPSALPLSPVIMVNKTTTEVRCEVKEAADVSHRL